MQLKGCTPGDRIPVGLLIQGRQGLKNGASDAAATAAAATAAAATAAASAAAAAAGAAAETSLHTPGFRV